MAKKTRARMPRRAGAARKKPRRSRATATARPFSSGFAYGVVVGAAAALGFVYYLPAMFGSEDMPSTEPAAETAALPTVDFEFIYRLPNERVITNVEPYRPPDHPAADSPSPARNDPAVEYLVQVGAFNAREKADATRAQLILSTNMGAQIESVRDQSGGTFHRVLIGPFAGRDEMQYTLATLQTMGVSAVPLERPRG